jgi:hypothetical protein
MVLEDPVRISLAARLTAVIASTATLAGVWHLAQRAGRIEARPDSSSDRWPWFGMAGLLLLITSLDWQAHSFEVRTDTYVLPLTLLAMALLWRAEVSWRAAIVIGLLVAATGLFSQKSVYNAGGIGLGWLAMIGIQAWNGRLRLKRQLAAAALALVTALALVALWYAVMALLRQDPGFVAKQIDTATRTAFNPSTSMADKWSNLTDAIGRAPVLWAMAGAGGLWSLGRGRKRPANLAALVLTLTMVGTIFVHRGYWSYFIASFSPYVALLAAVAVGGACRALHARIGAWAALLLLGALVSAQAWPAAEPYRALLATTNEPQFEVIRSIRDAFPEPVPYWDAIGIVAGYEETTFFGTGMSRKLFRKRTGSRGFIKRAQLRKPHFFIRDYMTRERYLRGPERRWLWRHYLPYRHNLYLHGGRIMAWKGQDSEGDIELLVGGSYTAWFYGDWRGDAELDGEPIQHAQQLRLKAGTHTLRARGRTGKGQLWLLLGADREPETRRISEHRDYSLYPHDSRLRYQKYDDSRRETADLLTPPGDPTVSEKSHKKRRQRHRKYLMKREKKLAPKRPKSSAEIR